MLKYQITPKNRKKIKVKFSDGIHWKYLPQLRFSCVSSQAQLWECKYLLDENFLPRVAIRDNHFVSTYFPDNPCMCRHMTDVNSS